MAPIFPCSRANDEAILQQLLIGAAEAVVEEFLVCVCVRLIKDASVLIAHSRCDLLLRFLKICTSIYIYLVVTTKENLVREEIRLWKDLELLLHAMM